MFTNIYEHYEHKAKLPHVTMSLSLSIA